MNTLIKETESFRLEHDLETNSVHHTVYRFLITDDWKDLLSSGLTYLRQNDLSAWLSDNRELPVIHQNVDEWVYSYWLPEMVESGWKKWAFVEPHIKTGKEANDKFKERFIEAGIVAKGFLCIDEAKDWLKTDN